MSRILIAEDEPRLADFLEKGLRAQGFATTVASDGTKASAIAHDDEFDLLVLDLGLPGKDGVEVLRDLRRSGQRMPVLILTARHDLDSTVAGLEAGADDYVTKPFRFEELLARIRARLRDEPTAEQTVLEVDGVTLDLRARLARVGGETIELSAREYAMLEVLMRHPGQVLSREQLISHVWGYDHDPGSNVVDVYVGYLRRKVGRGAIETVRGMGYRMPGGGRRDSARRARAREESLGWSRTH
jgi:DNA-binding response OmpR family regulator